MVVSTQQTIRHICPCRQISVMWRNFRLNVKIVYFRGILQWTNWNGHFDQQIGHLKWKNWVKKFAFGGKITNMRAFTTFPSPSIESVELDCKELQVDAYCILGIMFVLIVSANPFTSIWDSFCCCCETLQAKSSDLCLWMIF